MVKFMLLIMAVALAFNNFAQGFVLPHFAQLMGADYDYVEETPVAPTPTPSNIMRITPRNELRESGSDEIAKFIVDTAAAQSASHASMMRAEINTIESTKESAKESEKADAHDQQPRQNKTLTYTELDKLLAQWQLEKERNAYETQSRNRHRNAALRK